MSGSPPRLVPADSLTRLLELWPALTPEQRASVVDLASSMPTGHPTSDGRPFRRAARSSFVGRFIVNRGGRFVMRQVAKASDLIRPVRIGQHIRDVVPEHLAEHQLTNLARV